MKKFFVILTTLTLIAGVSVYFLFLKSNVKTTGSKAMLYIYNGDNFDKVTDEIDQAGQLMNIASFRIAASLLNYTDKVTPGRYELIDGENNLSLIRRLKNGTQSPVHVTFNNIRTLQKLAEKVTENLMMSEEELLSYLNSSEVLEKYDKSSETIITLFRPNTYEFYWNTTPEKLVGKIAKEYDKFWNEERTNLTEALKMSKEEVMTLASIVEEETAKNDERPMVAGLYLNRLKIDMMLQADPTIKFALQDFSLKRIYTNQIEAAASSPYNTYKHIGLPPGPIRIPASESIDAVLHHADHPYLYMCAKEDFSGYHNFAEDYESHKKNASRYRKALDERNIR